MKFKNGSEITQVSTEQNTRSKRANILTYWSDLLGCFVNYDGNMEEGNRYKYFILDDNDDIVYFEIVKEDKQ